MTMSYTGQFSIIDRGDAPAQAVIERNFQSLTQRVVKETKDELNKVMSRVHTIYSSMDAVEESGANPSMEYITDLIELEAFLKDEIKRRQYQKQVTVFIVGYQDVCHQKMRLIQQVNEFFIENSKVVDEEDWFPTTPDMDLDEACTAVEESLSHAHELTNRLAELNKEMVDYMIALSEKKTGSRGRKKIEKSLQQAREEVNNLKDRLLALQTELQDKEEKVHNMLKQLDLKNMDVQKFRTAAELGKQKLLLVQKDFEDQKKLFEETKASFSKLLDSQIRALQESHKREMEQLKRQHESEMKQMQEVAVRAAGGSFEAKTTEKAESHHNGIRSVAVQDGVTEQAQGSEIKRRVSVSRVVQRQQVKGHDLDQDQTPDLFDEEAWMAIPEDEVADRFTQYRQMSTHRLQELEGQLQLVTAKTHRKVTSLKTQFQEHKDKWEFERKLLIDQLSKLLKYQSEAEQGADEAITSLEDFIIQQEKLEHVQEVTEREAQLAKPAPDSLTAATLQPEDIQSSNMVTQVTHVTGAKSVNPDSEQDLERLMQLTDDAKVQERNARLTISTPQPLEKESSTADHLNGSGATSASPVEHINLDDREDISNLEHKTLAVNKETLVWDTSYPIIQKETLTEENVPAVVHKDIVEDKDVTAAVQKETLAVQTSEMLQGLSDGLSKEISLQAENTTDSSRQSWVSLRQHYKAKLEEVKMAAESRRSKSPGVHLPRELTLLDELIVEDEDEDDTMTPEQREVHKNDVGTLPVTPIRPLSNQQTSDTRASSQVLKSSRSGSHLLENPLLKEFFQLYDGVLHFKEEIGKLFLAKDVMWAYKKILELEMCSWHQGQEIEKLTQNALQVLDGLRMVISSHLEREHASPSSPSSHARESSEKLPKAQLATENILKLDDDNIPTATFPPLVSTSHSRKSSNASDRHLIQELQDQYNLLKEQLQEDGRCHNEQIQRNTVVMEEMQGTINELQQELARNKMSPTPVLSRVKEELQEMSPSPETSIMFTRLDFERNAKIMKKAVMDERLDPDKYKGAVSKMGEYISLPGKRLAQLVRKYIHHKHMAEIEEHMRNNSNVTQEVILALRKMDNLENKRSNNLTEKINGLGVERVKLAHLLMDTLDRVEQESGIFLIKPMYSYRGRDIKSDHHKKFNRPSKHRHRRMAPYSEVAASSGQVPKPSTNKSEQEQSEDLSGHPRLNPNVGTETPAEGAEVQVTYEQKSDPRTSILDTVGPGASWNVETSQSTRNVPINSLNTPRIFELDINRMLIGQNNVSSKLLSRPTDDRLVNASNNTLRSYVTVQRPSVTFGAGRSSPGFGRPSFSPRSSSKNFGVSKVDQEIPSTITSSQPLPPIQPEQGEEQAQKEMSRPHSVTSGYQDTSEFPRKQPGVFHVPV